MFMTIEKAPHPEQTHLMSKVPPLSAWGDPPRSARVFLMALRIGTAATALGIGGSTLAVQQKDRRPTTARCHNTDKKYSSKIQSGFTFLVVRFPGLLHASLNSLPQSPQESRLT